MPTLPEIPVPHRAAVLDARARTSDASVDLRRHPDPTRPVPWGGPPEREQESEMVDVRKATAADVRTLGRTMSRAFQEDPAFAWAVPNAQRRARFGPRYFELTIARTYLPKGEVYLTADGSAAALWAPPDAWQTSMTASLPFLPVMLRACTTNLPVALKMLTSMETRHQDQTEPHYYLPFIGTDPDHQGKGHGAALLADMLGRCDRDRVPAYLEATSLRNRSLYQRHGFQVLDELEWPNGGPPWWPMWREPQAH